MMFELPDMYSSLINTNQRHLLLGNQPILNENNLEHYNYGRRVSHVLNKLLIYIWI